MTLFKGLKNEFEISVVNEPSVFEPLKFYCIKQRVISHRHLYNIYPVRRPINLTANGRESPFFFNNFEDETKIFKHH